LTETVRKKTIQTYYSVRAKDYDQQKSRTWKSDQGFGTEVLDEVLNAFKSFQNKLLLEVGVGSGRNAKPLLEKIRPQLVGLDLTKEMLNITRKKMSAYKQNIDLILGDAEHMPFAPKVFDGILCVSTMHYFTDQEESVKDFKEKLKDKGTFVYGDLSPHEADNQEFFETLERTISKAHAKYYKASEIIKLLETHGFHVIRTKTIAYRKSYEKLIEDKARYFAVGPKRLERHVDVASKESRKRYALTDTELTQFYTIIVASRLAGSK
jgi:ubiquinone/menaquinone biosynthesis C-methylase UbiE